MPPARVSAAIGIPALERMVKEGSVIVARTIHSLRRVGPHPYLIGEDEAHAALDSVHRFLPQLKEELE